MASSEPPVRVRMVKTAEASNEASQISGRGLFGVIDRNRHCGQGDCCPPGEPHVPVGQKKSPAAVDQPRGTSLYQRFEAVTNQRIEAVASIRLASAMATVGSTSSSSVAPAVRSITFEMIRSRPSISVTTRIS